MKTTVVITIASGILEHVASTNPDLEYILIDHDNIEAGDTVTFNNKIEPDTIVTMADIEARIESLNKENHD